MIKRVMRLSTTSFVVGLSAILIVGGLFFTHTLINESSAKQYAQAKSLSIARNCSKGSHCTPSKPKLTPTRIATAVPTHAIISTSTNAKPSTQTVAVSTNGTRDAADQPYNSTSPWNMPIGSSAQFAAPTSPNWPDANKYGFIMTSDPKWSVSIYVAKASDPVRKIYRTDDTHPGYLAFTVHVPANIAVGQGGDDELAIIDPTHKSVIEMIHTAILPNGDIQAPFPNKIDLYGPGISDQYIGACAYGGSCSAGLIRKGEMAKGIHHALRMSLTPTTMNWSAPGGKHQVWPASSADTNGNYPGTGNIYIGSLMAIPASVDISKIAKPGTSLYNLAKALQDYGAYVTDAGYENIYVDPAAEQDVQSVNYNNALAPYLQVVTNNGPGSVGGGGTPREPLAAPLQP